MKKTSSLKITALVFTYNEAELLMNCLNGLSWCDEIVICDNGSTDSTVVLAQKAQVKLVSVLDESYAKRKELALKYCSNPWVFFVDVDERVVPNLAFEIEKQIQNDVYDVMMIKRNNIFYGQSMEYGDWSQDFVPRVFRTSSIKGWVGKIHESPVYEGRVIYLKNPMVHLTHRSVTDGLKKSTTWTAMEAQALFESNIGKVNIFTLIRKGGMEFVRRALLQGGFRDGAVGLIEAVTQAINRLLVYMQVWELQQKPSIVSKYDWEEQQIKKMWEEFK